MKIEKCNYANRYQAKRAPKCKCMACDDKWMLKKAIGTIRFLERCLNNGAKISKINGKTCIMRVTRSGPLIKNLFIDFAKTPHNDR